MPSGRAAQRSDGDGAPPVTTRGRRPTVRPTASVCGPQPAVSGRPAAGVPARCQWARLRWRACRSPAGAR